METLRNSMLQVFDTFKMAKSGINLMRKRLIATQYIQVSSEEMRHLGGRDEIIAHVGDTCYVTDTFLQLDTFRKNLYFLVEFLLQYTYITYDTIHPCSLLRAEKPLNSEESLMLLDKIATQGILDKPDYPFELGMLSQGYDLLEQKCKKHIESIKNQLQTVDKTSPIYVSLLENLVFLYEYKGLFSIYDKDWLCKYLPKVTKEKVMLYLKKLILYNDRFLGHVECHAHNDRVWHVDVCVTSIDTANRYSLSFWEYTCFCNLVYDAQTGLPITKRNRHYKDLVTELKIIEELTGTS